MHLVVVDLVVVDLVDVDHVDVVLVAHAHGQAVTRLRGSEAAGVSLHAALVPSAALADRVAAPVAPQQYTDHAQVVLVLLVAQTLLPTDVILVYVVAVHAALAAVVVTLILTQAILSVAILSPMLKFRGPHQNIHPL